MMEKEDQKEGSILFVCVENAGRSQMARAFSQKYGLNSESAGTVPLSKVNPTVVEVMKERGIDISKNIPRMLTPEMIRRSSLVVTMGCSVAEVCPRTVLAQMQKKLVDWNLTDPKGKPIEKVREIRDEIEKRVLGLIAESRSVSA
jgi:arsenate reductase